MSVFKILAQVDGSRENVPLAPVNSDNIKWLFDPVTGTLSVDFVESLPGVDHGSLSVLLDDDHTQYVLLAGRSGGQTLNGDTDSGGNLTLTSTFDATKGKIYFGTNAWYDEAAFSFNIESPTPTIRLTNTDFTVRFILLVDNDFADIGTITAHPLRLITGGVERLTILEDGRVGIGTSLPNAFAVLDLEGTTGALLLTRLTTTQRDALTAANGMVIYNTTTAKFQGYEAGAWTNLI